MPCLLQSISLRGPAQAISWVLMLHCTHINDRLIVDLRVQFENPSTQPSNWNRDAPLRTHDQLQKVSSKMNVLSTPTSGVIESGTVRYLGCGSRIRNTHFRKELIYAVNHMFELLNMYLRRSLRTLALKSTMYTNIELGGLA
ncbi:hypothetical protein FIBSPDRAFT_959792 [Athelia psychrophila]|uniref:Uncharacterized protein n=1 Tax=Athelia psychrophila TaxID=1759441 RepID=A0A166D5C4_9AGAM|nr:hypothetical protein FIBSPDRAFT_959792 [Fibularhizoctonia sp. CBS 109695]